MATPSDNRNFRHSNGQSQYEALEAGSERNGSMHSEASVPDNNLGLSRSSHNLSRQTGPTYMDSGGSQPNTRNDVENAATGQRMLPPISVVLKESGRYPLKQSDAQYITASARTAPQSSPPPSQSSQAPLKMFKQSLEGMPPNISQYTPQNPQLRRPTLDIADGRIYKSTSQTQVGNGYPDSSPMSADGPWQDGPTNHRLRPGPSPTDAAPTPSLFSYNYPSNAASVPAQESRVWQPPRADSPPAVAYTVSQRAPDAHRQSVKRHLEFYDLELAYGEIAENCSFAHGFCDRYANRLHRDQRAGIGPGTLPSLVEIDEVMNQTRQSLQALTRIKDILLAEQAVSIEKARLNQMLREQAQQTTHYRLVSGRPEVPELKRNDSVYQQADRRESMGEGGFAGPETKKRRGRNAAPGRCHSCNRAETPEWRRGPDGARTLCNACGLHYAKLTRKANTDKETVTNPTNPSSLRAQVEIDSR